MSILINIKLRTFTQQKFGINLHLIYKLFCYNGFLSSFMLLDKVWISLTSTDLQHIYLNIVKFFKVESFLQSQIFANIRQLKLLRGYKGFRHYYSLPVQGQRTKTNARTCKRLKKFIKKEDKILKKGKQKQTSAALKNKATTKVKSKKK